VQTSVILSRALKTVPPDRLMAALERLDTLPFVPLSPEALPPADPSVLRTRAAARARESVVQVRGTACGVPLAGSGWVAGDDLVVTNAHVIAGIASPQVLVPNGASLTGTPVYVDRIEDVALVRVPGLVAPALELGPAPGTPTDVVILGYPGGGALTAEAATAAAPRRVLADTIDGDVRPRDIVTVRGSLGPGSSGGPILDRAGAVVAMTFGATPGEQATAAVPPDQISRALAAPLAPVDSGSCVS
jgi:S1-C subfamily serine protease